jgi:predicted RNA-binding Zn-ribbon protein involved in translation (DUF1610 family)
MQLKAPEKVKCGACQFQLEPQWKETKWCPECKVYVCSRCRGGIKSNKCPKCSKLSLKPGAAGAEKAPDKQKVWRPAPGGENL